MTKSLPSQWGTNLQKAQTHQPDWESYVVTKIKSVRSVILSGMDVFDSEGFTFQKAFGFIELSGMRAGTFRTFLKIGFTKSNELDFPSFILEENAAIGTLILPSYCFGSTLQTVSNTLAHFRIGGDGSRNAIATDVSLLNSPLTQSIESSL